MFVFKGRREDIPFYWLYCPVKTFEFIPHPDHSDMVCTRLSFWYPIKISAVACRLNTLNKTAETSEVVRLQDEDKILIVGTKDSRLVEHWLYLYMNQNQQSSEYQLVKGDEHYNKQQQKLECAKKGLQEDTAKLRDAQKTFLLAKEAFANKLKKFHEDKRNQEEVLANERKELEKQRETLLQGQSKLLRDQNALQQAQLKLAKAQQLLAQDQLNLAKGQQALAKEQALLESKKHEFETWKQEEQQKSKKRKADDLSETFEPDVPETNQHVWDIFISNEESLQLALKALDEITKKFDHKDEFKLSPMQIYKEIKQNDIFRKDKEGFSTEGITKDTKDQAKKLAKKMLLYYHPDKNSASTTNEFWAQFATVITQRINNIKTQEWKRSRSGKLFPL